MSSNFSIDFFGCKPVHYLWPRFVENLGVEKAQHAVRQALDLQRMHGTNRTLPVLISETCGLALVNIDSVQLHSGYPPQSDCILLLINIRDKVIQFLQEV